MVINKKLLFNIIVTAALALIFLSGFVIFCSKSIIHNVLLSKAKEQLLIVRDFKQQQLDQFFLDLNKHVGFLTQDQIIKDSCQEFKLAFEQSAVSNNQNFNLVSPNQTLVGTEDDLQSSKKQHYMNIAIVQHYNNLAKQYKEHISVSKDKVDFSVFLQNLSSNGINLQTKYMTHYQDNAANLENYSSVHDKHHSYLQKITDEFNFSDLLLVDFSGNVIYSTKKNIDFASSLIRGAFSNTEMANVFNAVRYNSINNNTVASSNFTTYLPNYQEPVLFAASKIQDVGVLIVSVGLSSVNALLKLPEKMNKSSIYLVDQELRLINQDNFGQSVNTLAAREAAIGKKGFVEAVGRDKTMSLSYFAPIDNKSLSVVIETSKSVILDSLYKLLINMCCFTAAIIPVLLFFVYTICCLCVEKSDNKLSKISDFMQVVMTKKDLNSRMSLNGNDHTSGMADVLNNMLSWFQNTLDQIAFKVKHFVNKYNDLFNHVTVISNHMQAKQQLVDYVKNSSVDLSIESEKLQRDMQQYSDTIMSHRDACLALNNMNIKVNQQHNNLADLTYPMEYILNICNLADLLSLQVSLEASKNSKQQGHSFIILAKEIKNMTANLKGQLMQIKDSFKDYIAEHNAVHNFILEFSEKLKPINTHISQLTDSQKSLLTSTGLQVNAVNKLKNSLCDLEVKYNAVNTQLFAIVQNNSKLNAEIKIDDYYPLKVVDQGS